MFFNRIRSTSHQEVVLFNINQYEQLLSPADLVFLEDLKEEALSKTLTDEQQQEVLRISAELSKQAAENNLPSSSDDIARFIREFYQSIATAEQLKTVEIDVEKFEKFKGLLHVEDHNILREIRTGAELNGTLTHEDKNRITLIKKHFVEAVEKEGYDFSKSEIESYIDALIAPEPREHTATDSEPTPSYKVNRSELSDVDLPPTRFDLGETPKEDLR